MRYLLVLLFCLTASAQPALKLNNWNMLNQAYLMQYPPPPCSQVIATVMGSSTSSSDSVGVVAWYAFAFITTNGLAGTQPLCMDLTAATNGPTTATYQLAIYNDTTPSGKPGTVNGALSAAYNATALTASLTTNHYVLAPTAALSSSTITNYLVVKITGSTGNNDLQFGKWNGGSGLQTFSSSDGSTWSTFNTFDQWVYTFYK